MVRRYQIRTYGCQMNEADSERLAGLFDADGYERTDRADDADVIVLNTCCIRENADNRLYGALGHLKALKDGRPDLQIAVAGCLAQKDQELIQQRAGHVDVVFGTHNVHRAPQLLADARQHGPVIEILDAAARDDGEMFPTALATTRELDHAAWLTIQVGCDNSCAFCIVPAVRGPELSRPFGDLVADAVRLAADGVQEITLLGQNVNSYGRDITTARRRRDPDVEDAAAAGPVWADDPARRARPLFADLLRAVGAVSGIDRVRYTSPHPKDLRPETLAAMAETPAVCEHLHLPVQSGSDAVLAAMHRGYAADRYLDKLAAARAAIDDLAVSTDIIVGFPGETDADFDATLELAAAAQYDYAYTFQYSPRPGTEAAERTEAYVDPAVTNDRYERLRTVVERSALAQHRARVGRNEEVLIEAPSKKDERVMSGRTRQNKLVHVAATESLRPGTLATVTVTDAAAHYLHGELVEVLASPRRRTKIPVVAG
ncbi:MAG: MiaB/RimO family radical SAM methylthiotransferase [Acidimicrobiia bacterium]|nr:MiaB/RimO family radical SAM methylthiotransferase [Acidimicrobiia bacterium]